MPFHTRDWLDSKELRRCSAASRSVLIDLMALAHEGIPYGFLSDKLGPLSDEYMASRCVIPIKLFVKSIEELASMERIASGPPLSIPRMVRDEQVRLRRAGGGVRSVGHPNTHPPKQKKGYPSIDPLGDPSVYPSDHPSLKIDSRERALADSDSGVSSSFEDISKKEILSETSTLQFVEELESLYLQAGTPLAPKHKNLAVQLFMDIQPEKRPRVAAYVRHSLAGKWRDATKTKGLLNLLRDGDWDVPIVERTIPMPVNGAGRKRHALDEMLDEMRQAREN